MREQDRFEPSASLIAQFARAYNGTGLRKILSRIDGSQLDNADAGTLLREIVDDALEGLAESLGRADMTALSADIEGDNVRLLRRKIMVRLGKIEGHEGEKMADAIIGEMMRRH